MLAKYIVDFVYKPSCAYSAPVALLHMPALGALLTVTYNNALYKAVLKA